MGPPYASSIVAVVRTCALRLRTSSAGALQVGSCCWATRLAGSCGTSGISIARGSVLQGQLWTWHCCAAAVVPADHIAGRHLPSLAAFAASSMQSLPALLSQVDTLPVGQGQGSILLGRLHT